VIRCEHGQEVMNSGGVASSVIFCVALSAAFVTRLAFLDAGFGNDPDSWRVANVAREMALTGRYSASRLPGFPVHEIVCALFVPFGAVALNAASALMSAVAVALFALFMRREGCRDYALAGAAFAFTPVVYIASTTTIDYMWGSAFLVGALYLTRTYRPVSAGICVGIATGCRITSILMSAPLAYLFWTESVSRGDRAGKVLSSFIGAASVIAVTVLAPPFLTYGFGFLHYYETDSRTLLSSVRTMTIGVWGPLGFAGVLAAICGCVLYRCFKAHAARSVSSDSLLRASFMALALYGLAFLRLPHEPGYLIPTVPLFLFCLSRLLGRTAFVVACLAVVVSPFFQLATTDVREGPIVADYRERLLWTRFTRYVAQVEDTLPQNSVLVAGDWLPKLDRREPVSGHHRFFELTSEEAQMYAKQGFAIYYLPGQRRYAGGGIAQATPLVGDTVEEAHNFMLMRQEK